MDARKAIDRFNYKLIYLHYGRSGNLPALEHGITYWRKCIPFLLKGPFADHILADPAVVHTSQ
jgi:hypothetical protein